MLEILKVAISVLIILIFIGLSLFIINCSYKHIKVKKDLAELIISIIILGVLCYLWVYALNWLFF